MTPTNNKTTMATLSIRHLWGVAPVATINLVKYGLLTTTANSALSEAAVQAFDRYLAAHRSTGNEEFSSSQSSSHRRKRQRSTTTSASGHSLTSSSSSLTDNDYFFEHQRIRGYSLALSELATLPEAQQLEHTILPDLCTAYLNLIGTSRSNQMALLQQHQSTLFNMQMWAAIQRGAGAYHADHVHEDVIVSGVYYAAVPDGSAPLVLRRPMEPLSELIEHIHAKPGAQQNVVHDDESDVTIHPVEGQAVLFPPWLKHGVPLSDDNSNSSNSAARVSFAFNLHASGGSDPWSMTRLDDMA